MAHSYQQAITNELATLQISAPLELLQSGESATHKNKLPDDTMISLLTSPHANKLLKELEKSVAAEYSSENLDFLKAIGQLNLNAPSDQIKNACAEIMKKFILTDQYTPQVNLPYNAMENLKSVWSTEPFDIDQFLASLKTAAHEIIKLMQHDSLKRFAQSPLVKQAFLEMTPAEKKGILLDKITSLMTETENRLRIDPNTLTDKTIQKTHKKLYKHNVEFLNFKNNLENPVTTLSNSDFKKFITLHQERGKLIESYLESCKKADAHQPTEPSPTRRMR